MRPSTPRLLGRTLQQLIRSFAPEQIVLFGSYAKGTNHPGSDIDLLLIGNFPSGGEAYHRRARQLAGQCFPPVDVVFCTPEEAEEGSPARSPFLRSILASGVTLYRRGQSSQLSVL